MGHCASTNKRRTLSASSIDGPNSRSKLETMVHTNCRNRQYLNGPTRLRVEDHQVPWDSKFPEYDQNVVEFTAESVLKGPVWADPPENLEHIKFNEVDGKVNRKSHEGAYSIEQKTHRPRNPRGRTGMRGRGSLGRWGPNHAVDPIVTRWKRGPDGEILNDDHGKQLIEFVAIKRRDTGDWALPGGMVDAGEQMSVTLKREFGEEALSTLDATPEQRERIEAAVEQLFSHGVKIYAGYVDDPRNTDNSWMETLAMNFHDDTGEGLQAFELKGGDDATHAAWTTITEDLKLYASHREFIDLVVRRLHAQ